MNTHKLTDIFAEFNRRAAECKPPLEIGRPIPVAPDGSVNMAALDFLRVELFDTAPATN